jgi:hypothetical protein
MQQHGEDAQALLQSCSAMLSTGLFRGIMYEDSCGGEAWSTLMYSTYLTRVDSTIPSAPCTLDGCLLRVYVSYCTFRVGTTVVRSNVALTYTYVWSAPHLSLTTLCPPKHLQAYILL